MNIEIYKHLLTTTEISNVNSWNDLLQKKLEDVFLKPSHSHFPKWQSAVNQLPTSCTPHFNFNTPIIEVGSPNELSESQHGSVLQSLNTLHPWRKGPFNFFGTHIDSEWCCDRKWTRIRPHLPSLQNKTVLDIGCGNGYYMLRMLGAGARTVIGVDPTLLFMAQYYAIIQCIDQVLPAHLLPLPFEELPEQLNQFDCVFSMGVLYHRRNPIEHLQRLYQYTLPGGKIFLETLIIDQPESTELIPKDRYAGMLNVWSVPSPSLVLDWLHECGYEDIQLHNIHQTDIDEQRATKWMQNYSLINFLDSNNPSQTIEGYPRPARAIFSASRPN